MYKRTVIYMKMYSSEFVESINTLDFLMFRRNQREKMFKTTMIYVGVNLIIVTSCLATIAQEDDFQLDVKDRSIDTTSSPNQDDRIDSQKSSVAELSSLTMNKTSITRQIEASIAHITKFLNDTDGYNAKGCSDLQVQLSSSINELVKSIVTHFIVREKNDLSIISALEFPNIKGKFSNRTTITEFKLKNVTLKGFDTLFIKKLVYDVCKLSTDIDLNLPKLEMTAIYTLSGSIDNTPLSGEGNLTLKAHLVDFTEQSRMMCRAKSDSRTQCQMVNDNETIDIGAEEVKIHLTGIKHGNLAECVLNDALNDYIRHYLKSDKTQLKQMVSNIFTKYKKKYLMSIHPLKMLTIVKEYLTAIRKKMNKRFPFFLISNLITTVGGIVVRAL